MSKILDEIDDTIIPEVNSIKETRIDGLLEKKVKWSGVKWVNVCRYCNNDQFKNSMCQEHYKQQLKNNIIGEIIIKNNKKYVWTNSKEWKLVCSSDMCKNHATKMGKCTIHYNNPTTVYSSQQNAINMFHSIKEQFNIEKQKEKNARKI